MDEVSSGRRRPRPGGPRGGRATAALAAAAWLLAGAAAGQEGGAAAPRELDRRPGEGEQCLVCGQPIHGGEIVEVRYKGRSFHVAAEMLGHFEGDPDAYFAKLQASSALFDERSMEGRATSPGWLYFGLYVLTGLIFSALCGYLAVSRGLAPRPWFFAGLLANVAALAVLLAAPRGAGAADVPAGLAKVPTTHRPLPCPRCGAPNHPAAAACAACGAGLAPAIEAETVRV